MYIVLTLHCQSNRFDSVITNSDHQYARVLSSQKWKIILDPSFECNWYLVNRKRWGCPHYIFKRILLPIYVVVFIVYRILIANYNETGLVKKMTQTSMTTFPVVSAVICYLTWRSFPNFTTDRLFIREELKMTIALYALFAITSGITSLFVWLDLISEFLAGIVFQ